MTLTAQFATAAKKAGRKPARRLRLTPASAIKVRPVHWAWAGRLAVSTLALLAGREGIGKTILAYTIAADITRGTLDGAFKGKPRAVIVCSSEDSWEHTIVPRLMAAGADLELVFRIDVVAITTEASLLLPADLEELEALVTEMDAALVILDPLLPRLSPSLDSHKDADVRQALEPLVRLADETKCTILGLIHINKSTGCDLLTSVMASRAFTAVARSVLFVVQDPDIEGRRLLGVGKSNLGAVDLPSLAFTITSAKVADTAEGEVWTGRLEWAGESTRSITEAPEVAAGTAGDRSATSEAADWLNDHLAAAGGSDDSAAIRREGARAGHSKDALQRAKNQLQVRGSTGGFPRRSVWSLPDTAHTAPTAHTGDTPVHVVDAVDAASAVNGTRGHRV